MSDPISAAKARATLSEILDRSGFRGQRFRIQRHGRDVAGLISAEDLAKLETLEEILDLDQMRRSLAEPGEDVTWIRLRADLVR